MSLISSFLCSIMSLLSYILKQLFTVVQVASGGIYLAASRVRITGASQNTRDE